MGELKKISSVERAIQQAMGDNRTIGAGDDPAEKQLPELWRWLTTLYVGRDHIKNPATLSIRLAPGGVVCTLSDRDLKVGLDVGCPYLQDIFKAIEHALQDPATTFKTWGKGEPHLRKRRMST